VTAIELALTLAQDLEGRHEAPQLARLEEVLGS
jgi:hypothetical protein